MYCQYLFTLFLEYFYFLFFCIFNRYIYNVAFFRVCFSCFIWCLLCLLFVFFWCMMFLYKWDHSRRHGCRGSVLLLSIRRRGLSGLYSAADHGGGLTPGGGRLDLDGLTPGGQKRICLDPKNEFAFFSKMNLPFAKTNLPAVTVKTNLPLMKMNLPWKEIIENDCL